MKCKCGFNAEGGDQHLDNHIAFYARAPLAVQVLHGRPAA